MRAAFAASRRRDAAAFMPYVAAGYPSFRRLREALWECAEAGAALVEYGIPFSDPVADGPTLQRVLHDALRRGVTVRKSLDFVRSLRREGYETPLVGMTYANLLHAPGLAAAAKAWAAAGLDGAIVPDVPVEEARPLRRALHARGLATVAFASPSTDAARLRRALHAGDDFCYLVSVYGTTGTRRGLAPETVRLLRAARAARTGDRPPLCVGFGVARPSQAAALAQSGADGIIVGSALVARLEQGGVGPYVRSMVGAARSRRSRQ